MICISYDFFYYVEFNLYLCKEGKNNINNDFQCISYDKLSNLKNYFQIIFYYPILEFKEINFEIPIKIRYQKNTVF